DRKSAVAHVNEAVANDYKVVVVVAAMGQKSDPYATDTLLDVVQSNEAVIADREWDVLASCGEVISAVVFTSLLNKSGLNTTTMTGAQAGFRTNDVYREAKILDVKTDKLLRELEDHNVIVVTGFQ